MLERIYCHSDQKISTNRFFKNNFLPNADILFLTDKAFESDSRKLLRPCKTMQRCDCNFAVSENGIKMILRRGREITI